MNRFTGILLVSAALSLSASAQSQTDAQTGAKANGEASVQTDQTHAQASGNTSASSAQSAGGANAGLSSGTVFNAALNTPVDSKKAKPGDAVIAHTTQNVKSEGKTVLPRGTKLLGHITQASARAKGDSDSALAIAFDRAVLKDGREMPLNVAIQALAAAQTAASASETNADIMSNAGTSAGSSGMARGGSTLNGVTSTAGGAVGAVGNTTSTVNGATGATLNSATGVSGASRGAIGGLDATGQLTSNSRGVFGLSGLNLNSAVANNTQGSVIASAGKNVHLDSGTQMLMVTQASASVMPKQ
jgi:hypothetical protein